MSNKMNGVKAIGRKELTSHLKGLRLTPRRAVSAMCYDCMGGFTDGKHSCQIPDCPLFPFMPYREVEK